MLDFFVNIEHAIVEYSVGLVESEDSILLERGKRKG